MKRLSFTEKSLDRTSTSSQEMEGHTRWILSYADFMTLLVVIFLLSYFAMAGTKHDLFPAIHPTNASQSQSSQMIQLQQQIAEWIHRMKLEHLVELQVTPRGTIASFKEKFLFQSGKAEITETAREPLAEFGKFLREAPFHIRVEGHTDDVPISSAQYPSNWHLAAARATTVLYDLVNREHIPADKISSASYGDTKPRFPNDNAEHRAKNRRVDIIILSEPYKAENGSKGISLKNRIHNV